MSIAGISHVSIGASDVEASIEFYGWLGLTVDPRRPDFGFPGAWLQAGGQQVHLISSDLTPPGATNHFAFIVDDLDAYIAELNAHAVPARRSNHVPGAGYQAFVLDPSGNVVELNQPE